MAIRVKVAAVTSCMACISGCSQDLHQTPVIDEALASAFFIVKGSLWRANEHLLLQQVPFGVCDAHRISTGCLQGRFKSCGQQSLILECPPAHLGQGQCFAALARGTHVLLTPIWENSFCKHVLIWATEYSSRTSGISNSCHGPRPHSPQPKWW